MKASGSRAGRALGSQSEYSDLPSVCFLVLGVEFVPFAIPGGEPEPRFLDTQRERIRSDEPVGFPAPSPWSGLRKGRHTSPLGPASRAKFPTPLQGSETEGIVPWSLLPPPIPSPSGRPERRSADLPTLGASYSPCQHRTGPIDCFFLGVPQLNRAVGEGSPPLYVEAEFLH